MEHERDRPDVFHDPTVIVGPLTRRLDRSVLSFRSLPKPRFFMEAGGIRLVGFGFHTDRERYPRLHGPRG